MLRSAFLAYSVHLDLYVRADRKMFRVSYGRDGDRRGIGGAEMPRRLRSGGISVMEERKDYLATVHP